MDRFTVAPYCAAFSAHIYSVGGTQLTHFLLGHEFLLEVLPVMVVKVSYAGISRGKKPVKRSGLTLLQR